MTLKDFSWLSLRRLDMFRKKDRQPNADVRPVPESIEDVFLSPESYIPPHALQELWRSCYSNPINYGESMRKSHAAEYERAVHDLIESGKEEMRIIQRRIRYMPEIGLFGRAKARVSMYVRKRRERHNPQT